MLTLRSPGCRRRVSRGARRLKRAATPRCLRPVSDPFGADGGLKVLRGNLGRAVIKTSAVQPQHRVVEAPAIVFDDQADVIHAFQAARWRAIASSSCAIRVRARTACPSFTSSRRRSAPLQSKGFKVALVTDGRMSGASGAVPAAIHVTPECLAGGPLAKVQTGDVVRLDSYAGVLEVRVDAEVLQNRSAPPPDLKRNELWRRPRALRNVPPRRERCRKRRRVHLRK